jgi:hypothetical protein
MLGYALLNNYCVLTYAAYELTPAPTSEFNRFPGGFCVFHSYSAEAPEMIGDVTTMR